jgi:hypothetical protein
MLREQLMPRVLALFVVGLAALGAVGCKDFHYYDVDVSFGGSFLGNSVTKTMTCHVYVSGADSTDFYITENCPPPNVGYHVGIFEYSSLADSGHLTFEVKTFNGIPEGPSCQNGDGMTTIPITSTTTTSGTLTIDMSGAGCM